MQWFINHALLGKVCRKIFPDTIKIFLAYFILDNCLVNPSEQQVLRGGEGNADNVFFFFP